MRPTPMAKRNNSPAVLKKSGSDISGTVRPNEMSSFLSKGKIDGDKITLESITCGHNDV